jgi:DNA-binding CsgD family transcriptional regulator/tetratricopeptide (TPR) repeat protein
MRAGLSAESLAAALASLNGAMAAPGIAARHRARLLVLAAQSHDCAGDAGMAGQAAASALAAAEEAGDNLAAGWALHVLALVAAGEGRAADALPLFDRALAAAHADPALADLRLALLVDKGLALGSLDRHEQAFGAVGQARHIADQGGTAGQQTRVHGALAWLLFQTGRWDEALTEVAVIPENPWEPGAARGEHAIAAVISFHRGDTGAARRHLAAAGPHSGPAGRRLPGPLALARSLDREQDGALPEALAQLADACGGAGEEHGAPEDLFADAVRLAARTGDLATGRAVAARAAALAAGSQVPHQQANALYCGGLLDHDAARLLAAAELYEDAGWPLLSATALEAAAGEFVREGDRGKARDAFNRAAEIYASLDADADAARLLADFRAHGIRRGPHSRHRRAQTGWDSLTPTEIKIAGFVEEGLSNPDIAARMLLSGRTVATHVSHILKKLGVHSRTDIARESALRGVASRGLPGPGSSGTPAGASWPGLREAWPHRPDVVPHGGRFRDQRVTDAAAAV